VKRSPARTIITIVMDILIACAVVLTLRLGVRFFGQLAAQSWGKAIVAFTSPLLIPLGVHAIKTPYGGVFDVNAAIMICLLLLVEWILSGIRGRA
jgi:uncharacterized protein YggT (Ycf19 family)